MRVSPPFTAIQSFNATSLILAYASYERNVAVFLSKLSKNAGNYYKSHKEILHSILEHGPVKRTCPSLDKPRFKNYFQVDFEYPSVSTYFKMKDAGYDARVQSIVIEKDRK